jgi:putative peptidoglycan binding protein
MNVRGKVLTAALLSASVGLGAQSIFAQNAPSGGSSTSGMPGQSVPQPGPRTQPTIPGQPAPGLPQTDPMPGQPGTIPERAQQPRASDSQNMAVSAEHIRQAQQALKAKGLNPGTDGKMDDKTQQALRDFQKVNNLPATGVLDAQTAAKLGITLDSGKSTGSSSGVSGSAGSSSKSGTSSSPSSSKSAE